MRKLTLLLFLAVLLGAAATSYADLNGSTVTGTLLFEFDSTNYFDPANGYVPSGYSNASDFTVVIDPMVPTFGFNDGANLNVAAFAGDVLTITDTNACCGAGGWMMTFTDTAFTTFTKTTDTFSNGGLTSSFNASTHTFTITWAGDANENWNYSATFAPNTVCSLGTDCALSPDPPSFVLLGTSGVLGACALFGNTLPGLLRRRKAVTEEGEEEL